MSIDYKKRYEEYLQTDHWKNLRADALATTSHKCSACSSAFMVDVHHLAYRNLTDCTVKDVVPLCRKCHYAAHKSGKLKESCRGKSSTEKLKITNSHLRKFQAPTFRQYEAASQAKALKLIENRRWADGFEEDEIVSLLVTIIQIMHSRKRWRESERLRKEEGRSRAKSLIQTRRQRMKDYLRQEAFVKDSLAIDALCFITRKVIREMNSRLSGLVNC